VTPRPLDGLTVVALEQVIAGPFCSRQLADLGARVIKIERPVGGDPARSYDHTVHGQSSHFVWVNRSKESFALDVKHPEAPAILGRLLAKADVFLHNLAPGAVERLGLGSAELRARHPRLVWCGISGYGPDGPYAKKKAYDLLVQCEAGLLSVTGTEDAPSKAGIPVADIAAGMYAFSGILAALLRRVTTGIGSTLDISMFEALGEWMGFPAYFTHYGGARPPRLGAHHATIVPYGPFRAGDGGTVFLGVQNDREFARFCEEVLGNGGSRAIRATPTARPGVRIATPCTPRSSACSARSLRRGWRRASSLPASPLRASTTWLRSGPIRSSLRASAGVRWRRPPVPRRR
jgi:crotonobetainyl-CoA:carnitine CoA-transferase CaiB-like acyl-CoA transferase